MPVGGPSPGSGVVVDASESALGSTAQRVLRATAATVTLEWTDQEGDLADADGAVTANVYRWDGTVVRTAAAMTKPTDTTGLYTLALTPAETAVLDELTMVGTDTAGVAKAVRVEIVGGFWFSTTRARTTQQSLADTTKYPTADMVTTRQEVEDEAERIIGASFVPRFRVVRLHGQGTNELNLPSFHVRRIRGVLVDGTALAGSVVTALALQTRTLIGSGYRFPLGTANVVVAYEHGRDEPPADLGDAAILRLRTRLNKPKSGIPETASTFSSAEGGTYGLIVAGRGDNPTGIAEVDSVYVDYRNRYRSDLVSVPLR